VQLALFAELHEAPRPLWDTLDVGYFMRHDAGDIAWHARSCGATWTRPRPSWCARASSVGEGLQVLVYTPDVPDLFARICGYFDQAGFSILDAKVHTARNGYGARHLPGASVNSMLEP
jgi:[protein-PII] uridylyltransferase